MNWLLVIIAVALAALRMAGHTSEAYQAAAHLFVGGLFAAGYVEYRLTWDRGGDNAMLKIFLGIGLSVVEVACFVWFRFFVLAAAVLLVGCESRQSREFHTKYTDTTIHPLDQQENIDRNLQQTGVDDVQVPLETRIEHARENGLPPPRDAA